MDFKRFWRAIRKNRWLCLLIFLVVFAGSAAYTFTLQPVYSATSELLFERHDKTLSTLGRDGSGLSNFQSLAQGGSPLDTQAELLRSRPILERVIKEADVRDPKTHQPMDFADFLLNVDVEPVKGTDVLALTVQADTPEGSKKQADIWAQVFVDSNLADNRRESATAARFIEKQVAKAKAETDAAEKAVEDFKQKAGAVDLNEESRQAVTTLAQLEGSIRESKAAEADATARASALRKQVGIGANQALDEAALTQDPELQELRRELLAEETNPILAEQNYTDAHPQVKLLKSHIEMLRKQMADKASQILGRRYNASPDQEMDPARLSLTQNMIGAQVEALGRENRLDAEKHELTNLNAKLSSLPAQQYTLTQLERRALIAADNFKTLQEKLQDARIQEDLKLATVRIVEQAVQPDIPIKPNWSNDLSIGFVLGLFLAAGAAYTIEMLNQRIEHVDDAERVLGMPMLGMIPWLPHRKESRLPMLEAPHSAVAEAYRKLRTNIRFLGQESPMKCIALTSVGSGEGKSTTVANLAVSLAQAGIKTLVVDGDLRRPTLHRFFGDTDEAIAAVKASLAEVDEATSLIPGLDLSEELPDARSVEKLIASAYKLAGSIGLASVLNGEVQFEYAVRELSVPNLYYLPAGPEPANPTELLESPMFERMIAQAKEHYDAVIIDAPPAIAVSDAQVIASRVDGVVFVSRLGKNTSEATLHALNILQSSRAHVLGAVLRGLRSDNAPEYHEYYREYYGTPDRAKPRVYG